MDFLNDVTPTQLSFPYLCGQYKYTQSEVKITSVLAAEGTLLNTAAILFSGNFSSLHCIHLALAGH